ncbi:glycosyl transferase family 2 [Stella humosa]|uniref:Glycosyl transferase family 2 n=1 Tax=Stella humosa TaxID=94 RepID=A0A3N1M7P6_9PROT|nr:glycosyltransferase family 2 protein [Stella humosa]ROP99710.1 glycosyl transferase family 2 [Stella humosa]BBK31063.1 beta 1,4 glucosyltransferase [Stella humosa]
MTAISAIVTAGDRDELAECLSFLSFADEIVVVTSQTRDRTPEVARRFGAYLLQGTWAREGERRNAAIEACTGPWVLEIDSHERVTAELAAELRYLTAISPFTSHELPVDTFVGRHLIRHGWGGAYGEDAYPGLFRKGAKRWGLERSQPSLTLDPNRGPRLQNPVERHAYRNLSGLLHRLDHNTTLRAADLREAGGLGRRRSAVCRSAAEFWQCYVRRKGWREGGFGLMIATCAGLDPLLSHLKAELEDE